MQGVESSSRFRLWSPMILATLIALTYVRGITNGFVAEDFYSIIDSRVSFGEMWQYMLSATRIRPVWFWFQWVLTQLFDMNPIGYHVVIILLHIGIALLLMVVATTITRSWRIGFIAALVFAVYPRNHQVVLWYGANQYLLMTFFALLCVYGFEKYLDTRKVKWQALVVVSLALSLMSHEAGVALFPLLVILELVTYSPETIFKTLRNRQFYAKYIPYVTVFIVYFGITFAGPRFFKLTGAENLQAGELNSVGNSVEAYSLTRFGVNQIKDMVTYLTYWVYPQIPLRSLDFDATSGLIALSASLVWLILFLKGSKIIRFGILWSFVTLVVFVFFVPFGNADRYFYLPAVGFSIIAGVLIVRLYDWLAARNVTLGYSVAGVVLVAYLGSSVWLIQQRIEEWRIAGEMVSGLVDGVLVKYPNPAPNSTVLVVNPPSEYGQAYVFLGGGVVEALRLAYGEQAKDVAIHEVRDENVIQYLYNAQPVENPLSDVHVLFYENGILLDKSSAVDNLQRLAPENWS